MTTQIYKKNNRGFFMQSFPLFLVLFLDGMGLGLVIPILNGLLSESSLGFFKNLMLPSHVIYGLTIGIFMLCWFFGAVILGDLSDTIGRKKSLFICLIGSFLGYLLSAFAVVSRSLSLLLLGRVIAGLTSGSQPIAQAAIVDLSSEEHKARNIGFILFSLSLGFIVGPLLGGLLSDHQIVSWFGLSVPLYFAALVSLINAILLCILFKESYIHTAKQVIKKINLRHSLNLFLSAFIRKEIRQLSVVYFMFILGWSSFYSFIAVYLTQKFSYNTTKISLMMAVMGIGFGIGNTILMKYLPKRFSLKAKSLLALVMSAACILIMILTHTVLVIWIMMIPLAAFISLSFSTLLTLFSNRVDQYSQGWVMGVTGSIMALVWAIDAIVGGVFAEYNVFIPMLLAITGLLLAGIILKVGKEKN